MADLMSVVVGGLLAVGGSVTIQWVAHRLKSDDEKRTRRIAKFEELVAAMYEYDYWLRETEKVRVYGREGNPGMSPFAKIQALSVTHFPDFERPLTELFVTGKSYETWMFQAGIKRMDMVKILIPACMTRTTCTWTPC